MMSTNGFIVRYVTEGDFMNRTDRWDLYTLSVANSVIEDLKVGKGIRTFGNGLREGDLIGLFSTPQCDPAEERITNLLHRNMTPEEFRKKVFGDEKELRFLEYLNGHWTEFRNGGVFDTGLGMLRR